MRVLITGANRGIGHELAKRYALRGDDVIATGRSDPGLDGVRWTDMDVTDHAAISAASAEHREALDLLICNAGVYRDKLQQLDNGFAPEVWAESFAVNVTGVFLTIQAFLPQLRAASTSKIAILSSQMGSTTNAPGGSFAYRASKAAAINLGRNLATDLQPDRIAVGIYHPGWVQTQMGGKVADITVDASAVGLIERFEALSIGTTGVFETWDGRAHPI